MDRSFGAPRSALPLEFAVCYRGMGNDRDKRDRCKQVRMAFRPRTSRQQFREYRRQLRVRRNGVDAISDGKRSTPGTPQGRRHRPFGELLRRFWRLLAPYRAGVVIALATLTVSTLLRLVPPAATKIAIDYILLAEPWPKWVTDRVTLSSDPKQLLATLAGIIIGLSVIETSVHLWGRWRATTAAKRLQADTRKRLFEHSLDLPLHRVADMKSGGVTSILQTDAAGVGELVFSMLYNPWRAIVQLLGSLAVLAWVDWRLLLSSLVLVPTVYLTHRTWIGRIRPLYRDIRQQRQEVDSHAVEAFGGMRVVRAFGRQRSEAGRFVRGNQYMARQELHAWWWARIVELVWEILLPLASAGLLWYGGSRVLSGALSLGDLTMFLAYLAMLLGPLAVLANSATQFQNNLAGFDRVLDLLDEPEEMPVRDDAVPLERDRVQGHITLANVGFRYPTREEWALREIDLDVRPGELVALVGPSGAGKTTLCNLVARFYDPTQGSVRIDGIDLRDVNLNHYRRLLGVVEQDIFLFDGTIAENIAYAARRVDRDAIKAAAEVANAHEFIAELPEAYDTLIGERGVRLSGGQRQRIAIARAVLADPRILILDEATSNLDTHSERLIQASLEVLLRGRTSFVIAHRLSTVRHADRIVVLEQGRIVEQGTHDELVAVSGSYRRMVQLQLEAPADLPFS